MKPTCPNLVNSLRSQLFIFLLKHRHWFRLKLKRETVDWDTSIPELRQRVEKSAGMFGKLPSGIEASPVTIAGLSAEWIRPSQTREDRAILYFHGGGYVMGSCRAHRAIVAKFVAGSGISALVFDYRLAPEHPFEDESMLDDSVQFAEKARNAGVKARLQVGKGMVHCYPALSPFFPEAKEAMEDICIFLRIRTETQLTRADA